jgi:PadR family transcriptional regulator PadR
MYKEVTSMKIEKALLSGSTPLLVLSLLKDGDKYGYQMVTELAKRSDDTFQLKEGTLYPLLHTLEKNGFVTSYLHSTPGGRERKYYRLTNAGREQLEYKEQEWRLFSEKVNAVLGCAGC